jgi:hypothetical protein
MADTAQLAIDVLRRLGMAGDLPKTDYYTNVSAKVPQNAPYPSNMPDLVLGGKPQRQGAATGLEKYPNVQREWQAITKQYPGAGASDIAPMGFLERARNYLGDVVAGNWPDTGWSNPGVEGRSTGNKITFNPSVERNKPEDIRRLLLHEATHGAQTRNFPTPEWADRRNYKPGQYWTSIGEGQAFETEDQDARGGLSRDAERQQFWASVKPTARK